MSWKQIKCHKCYGSGCNYCDGTGLVSRKKGNKKLIDKYFDSLNLNR